MINDVEVIDASQVEVVNASKNEVAEIDAKGAKQLTNDIKSTSTALYVLLKRAHDTKAWKALGYNSWTEYIEKEFEFSRARSYQLINQANVIEEINEASGVELYLTESEARSIKKRLPEITEKLEEVKGLDDEEEAKERVREIIEESKDEIDNSAGYQDDDGLEDDRKGFSKGGGDDDGWDDPESMEAESSSVTTFSPQVKFASERTLETLKVFEMFPNALDIGKYLKGNDKEEALRLGKNAVVWLNRMLSEIEGDE